MKETQCQTLARLLSRKTGVTSMEIIEKCGTVSPHSRIARLKARGWTVRAEEVQGRNFLRYFGTPPENKATKA